MDKIINIGLVGCGNIAQYAHLPCLIRLPGVKVVSVMDPKKEKAKLTAERYGVKKYYTNLEDMLRDSSIDAIDICSPPKAHAEQIVEIAEMSKPIICEKPIVTCLEEANRIKIAVEKTNILFMTGFTYRFHPLIRITRENIKEPHILRVNYSFRPTVTPEHWISDLKDAGGFLVEQAVHWFDLFGWWCGKPKTIYAATDSQTSLDAAVVVLSYRNGALGIIAYNSRGMRHFFHLTLENDERAAEFQANLFPSKWGGYLRLDIEREGHRDYTLGGWRVYQSSKNPIFPLLSILAKVQDAHLVPFYFEFDHFFRCLQNDTQPMVSLKEGLEALEIAVAAKNSINTGKMVAI